MRAEREGTRRSNAGVIISTVLSLLVVAAAVAVVAYLVLREPSSAVDSAQRLDPVGTALPAPTNQPELPTAVPPTEPPAEAEPTALGFSGEQPAVAGLPTVAAPQEPAGPTPTPRLIAQPTEAPPTPVPAAPTLPPSVPVTEVPVVALQPVEAAPPPAPTSAAAPDQSTNQPTPAPRDNDPFDIFDDENESRIVPAVDDPLERVRDMQDEQRGNNQDDETDDGERRNDTVPMPTVEVPEVVVPSAGSDDNDNGNDRNEPAVAGVPDVDAMIDEITARATDPDRNPNVKPPGRQVTSDKDEDDEDDDRKGTSSSDKKRKSVRDRIRERMGNSDSSRDDDDEESRPNFPGNNGQQNGNDDGPCLDPTAPGFPFDC